VVEPGGLADDGGYDRLNGPLELSIKSVRMNAASLRLLSMFGTREYVARTRPPAADHQRRLAAASPDAAGG
jgi:hypothetical protein